MNRKDLETKYTKLCSDLSDGRIKHAIDILAEMAGRSGKQEYFYQLEEMSKNYKALLKYAFDGYKDPHQQSILNTIRVSLFSIADALKEQLSEPFFPWRKIEKQEVIRNFGESSDVLISNIDDLFFSEELAALLNEKKGAGLRKLAMERLFKLIWLTRTFKEPHLVLIRKIIHSETVIPPEKCLIVSAVSLSLLDYFDPQKFEILIEFAEKREDQVHQRALTGIVLALLRYDRRIPFYPLILEKLSELSEDGNFRQEIEIILFQLLMAKETEKITRKFEEEVLPDMKKMMPRLEDKLQLENLVENDDPDDKNPGWKELLEEVPGLFDKMEKFTKMQLEGADVFMGTFSMLKRFDFFNRMSNWFVPFYAENVEVNALFTEDQEFESRLLKQLEKAFYICNSDKYSFALNFMAIPQQQKSMIVTQFEAEMEQMREMVSEEEILGQEISSHAVPTQYIQDLYRFFKLYPSKNEFTDPFLERIDYSALSFFRFFFDSNAFLEKVAHFYFENGHYEEAIGIFLHLAEKEQPNGDFFEKIAFSFQKMGKFRDAISWYRKAELFDSNRLWILKKLGWCYLKLKEPEHALPFFEDAAKLQPDDLTLQAQIGQCHLSAGQYGEALQHFSQVVYYQPENLKALRPVAYCHFILGMLVEANELYEGILTSGSATPYDYLNAGHVALCLSRKQDAIARYRSCLTEKTFSREMFMDAFREDIPHILKNGIKAEEVPLILDHILFELS